jgi:hypothetical protein
MKEERSKYNGRNPEGSVIYREDRGEPKEVSVEEFKTLIKDTIGRKNKHIQKVFISVSILLSIGSFISGIFFGLMLGG